jgi:hypothetical protein
MPDEEDDWSHRCHHGNSLSGHRLCDFTILGAFVSHLEQPGYKSLPEDAEDFPKSAACLKDLLDDMLCRGVGTLGGHTHCSPAGRYASLRDMFREDSIFWSQLLEPEHWKGLEERAKKEGFEYWCWI